MKEFRRTSGLSNPAVAIGIAPWGCIKNRDSLVCKDSDTLNKEVQRLLLQFLSHNCFPKARTIYWKGRDIQCKSSVKYFS